MTHPLQPSRPRRLPLAAALAALVLLVASSAFAASAPRRIGAAELAAVTGGVCTTCNDDPSGGGGGGGNDGPPLIIDYQWRRYSSHTHPAVDLEAVVVKSVSNIYGSSPKSWTFSANDHCKWAVTSGGAGIANGFNVSIGTTRYCDQTISLSGTVSPGWRTKVYRGSMRQETSLVARQYALYDNGTSTWTGRSDSGKKVRTWNRYSTVDTQTP